MNRFLFIILVLLSSSFLQGQDFVEKLRSQLDGYVSNGYPKIYLGFHQPEYAAGDTAFFKGYLWKTSDISIKGKTVINVALVNSDGKEVVFRRVLFTDGTGSGYLPLPNDLTSGFYAVYAFADEAKIGNTAPLWQTSLHVVSSKRMVLKPAELTVKAEGGALVAGVPNTMFVKSVGAFQGQVTDENGATAVDGLASDKDGWLKFVLSPEAGRKYSLVIGPRKYSLGEVSSAGAALSVLADSATATYNVKVMSPGRASGYAVVTANNRIVYAQSIDLSSESLLAIPFSRTMPGINRLTIFSEAGDVLAERVFYKRSTPDVKVTLTKKAVAATRENLQMGINFTDKNGAPVNGSFSVTVRKEDVFSDARNLPASLRVGINSELGLTGFEEPVDPAHIDEYLVLHYAAAVPWSVVRSGSASKAARVNPYYFQGKATMGNSVTPAPDSTLVTFYLNNYDVIFGVYVRDGKLEFPLYMNFQDDELFYRATLRKKILPGVVVTLGTRSTLKPPAAETTTLQELDPYEQFANMKSKVNSSFSFYNTNDKKPVPIEGDDWNVDFAVNLERINPFPNMIETLHNVVPAVKLRKNNDQYVVRIFTKEAATYSQEAPVFIIDGVMTDSVDFFLSLDPKKLARIGVIRSKQKMARYGSIGTGGVVLIESKDKIYHDIVPRSSHAISVTGIQKPVPFFIPVYGAGKGDRTPDLRSVLYWDPSVPLSNGAAVINFSSGDLSGKFNVHVEGRTEKGEFIQHDESFDIGFSRP